MNGMNGVLTDGRESDSTSAQFYGTRLRLNHGSLGDTFWRDFIGKRGRRWLVVVLHDGDLFPRDAVAYWALRECLRERTDVEFRFFRAWAPATDELSLDGVDILFLGRSRPVYNTSLGPPATRLEAMMKGKFRDPRTGTTSNSIWYGSRRFRRHELQVSPEEPRRCDLDYGILVWRSEKDGDAERRVVAIAGLSTLGTLGLTLILTDDGRRAELLRQVRELAPWKPEWRPDQGGEICVRIDVGPERLPHFLNNPTFDFRVEAVAVDGGETHVREAAATFEVFPRADGYGTMQLDGATARVSPARVELLRWLVDHPDEAGTKDLCAGLHRTPRTLAKLVHDLNASMSKRIPSLEHIRFVRYRKKLDSYVLAAPGKVHPAPAPPLIGPASGRRKKP